MNKLLLALAASLLLTGPAFASAESDAMAPVLQFLDAFNKGDTKAMLASSADQMSIIDEFPPHEWHGSGALSRWLSDYDSDATKNGITDGAVTFGKPQHVDVSGDRAYVVLPADYAYKVKGVQVKETGSLITLALIKGADGWRITGWAWSKH